MVGSSAGSIDDIVARLLARSKTKGRVNDDGQNDRTEDADRGAVGIDRNRCQGARGGGNDGDDDGRLCHRLSLDFEGELHRPKRRRRPKKSEERKGGWT